MAIEAVVPMRAEGREGAEMVSQLLFGELVEQIEAGEGNWVKVRSLHDEYEGWVTSYMISEFEDELLYEHRWVEDRNTWLYLPNGERIHLPMGASIPLRKNQEVIYGRELVSIDPMPSPERDPKNTIAEVAERYIGTPYLWGGRSNFGIDCSGLVQVIYGMCGIKLPRDSSQQAKRGKAIDFADRKPGDLVFLSKPDSDRVTHVGILSNNLKLIHASGRVREDELDEKGTKARLGGYAGHRLVEIRRL